VADKRRFDLFARFIVGRFAAPRIYDVAGGLGRLNEELTRLGRSVTTFDQRVKHAPVRYVERAFSLAEPCECDLVVGLHPDGATRGIIEFGAMHRIPFAVVPCCSDNGMPYKPWMRHLVVLAEASGFRVELASLAMEGRSQVIVGSPPSATV
jgi:hypothetical protein